MRLRISADKVTLAAAFATACLAIVGLLWNWQRQHAPWQDLLPIVGMAFPTAVIGFRLIRPRRELP